MQPLHCFTCSSVHVEIMRYSIVLSLLMLAASPLGATGSEPVNAFGARISALEISSGGRIGVSVVGTDGSRLLAHRQDERFALCSTFKVLLAASVLARVDANQETLERTLAYSSADLLDHAPITKANLAAGKMTIGELNAASIQYSDNTAANLLLAASGGPSGLTRYLRAIGDTTTRLDRNEPSLNTNLADDPRDTTTPAAMSATLRTLLAGSRLSPASREQLKRWMFGNTTGNHKLRAGFDPGWIIGDKTGSCGNGGSNNVAIVYPRGMQPFIISVFHTGSHAGNDEKNAVLAEVARATQSALQGNPAR